MNSDLEKELLATGLPAYDAADLAELAREIEELAGVPPRQTWLSKSKSRLLQRFEEQRRIAGSGSPEA